MVFGDVGRYACEICSLHSENIIKVGMINLVSPNDVKTCNILTVYI